MLHTAKKINGIVLFIPAAASWSLLLNWVKHLHDLFMDFVFFQVGHLETLKHFTWLDQLSIYLLQPCLFLSIALRTIPYPLFELLICSFECFWLCNQAVNASSDLVHALIDKTNVTLLSHWFFDCFLHGFHFETVLLFKLPNETNDHLTFFCIFGFLLL